MKTISVLALIFLPSIVFAKNVTINVDGMGYSSPAAMHLNNLQAELARKAVLACGTVEAVAAINDVSIKISASDVSHGSVAGLAKGEFGLDLNLNYPMLSASAVVTCK